MNEVHNARDAGIGNPLEQTRVRSPAEIQERQARRPDQQSLQGGVASNHRQGDRPKEREPGQHRSVQEKESASQTSQHQIPREIESEEGVGEPNERNEQKSHRAVEEPRDRWGPSLVGEDQQDGGCTPEGSAEKILDDHIQMGGVAEEEDDKV